MERCKSACLPVVTCPKLPRIEARGSSSNGIWVAKTAELHDRYGCIFYGEHYVSQWKLHMYGIAITVY